MKLSDERARAIAEAAIELEEAKQAVLTQRRKRWSFFEEHHIGVYPNGWDTRNNEDAHMASYDVEAVLMKDRDSKRRAYQRQIKSALLEMAS